MKKKEKHFQWIKAFAFAILLVSSITDTKADCKYERIIGAEEIAVGILINWSTCLEQDNSMFIVEKSMDGLHFQNLGAVKGAGHSKVKKEYSFLDIEPGQERVFYRLRQINFIGTYSFSEILSVNKQNSNHFMVTKMSSVAATAHFEVSINSRIEGNLSYSLLDWKGNVINVEETPLFEGMNKVSVDLAGLPNAIYRLELQVNEEIETLTFKKVPMDDPENPEMVKSKTCNSSVKSNN